MVVIRLARVGSKNNPKYRIHVADSRRAVQGCFIERIGHYNPLQDKRFVIQKDRYEHWLSQGAQPSQTLKSLYKKHSQSTTNKESMT